MEELQKVQIGGQTYPVKMDLCVLEYIQENYSSIRQWELDILGIGVVKDEEGHVVVDEDGETKAYLKEPSVKAIRAALYPMVNEGLEIEAEQTGKSWVPVTRKFIDRECHTDYRQLADFIHAEFKRCFAVKK